MTEQSSQRLRVLRSTATLTAVQIAGYVAPLVIIPFLIRTAGVAGWGKAAFALSFATYVGIVVEFGFSYSGTAAVARLAASGDESAPELGAMLSSVSVVKLVLSTIVVLIACALRPVTPILRGDLLLFISALAYGVMQGLGLAWFFHGMEWMRVIAALEVSAKLLATVLILLLVRGPGDEWLVLAAYAFGAFAVLVSCYVVAVRRTRIVVPRWSSVRLSFGQGWWSFVFRVSASMLSMGGPFLLGLFRSTTEVGHFATADRLMRSIVGLMRPFSQALFPRISSLLRHDRSAAERLHRRATTAVVSGSVLVAMCTWLLATPIMALAFGERTPQAESIFRLLVLVIPAAAVSNALGVQWLIPTGRARSLALVVAGVGVATALAGAFVATTFGAKEFSAVIAAGEWSIAVGLVLLMSRREHRGA